MSTLWLLLVPVCTAIYTLLLPIAPNDFWYHARAGAEIVATGQIPRVALFSSSAAPGTPYFYQSWIAEVALYQTLRWGGLAWIVILRTVCLTFSFALLQFAVWRRLKRATPQVELTSLARLAAMSTLLAFALSASNMDIRPQTFSVPLFCAFVFALYEWPFLAARHRVLAIATLAILMVAWANTHGAFFTGLILLVVFLCAEILFAWLSARKQNVLVHKPGTPLAKPQIVALAVLASLGVGATLVNPRGADIYRYVFLLARDKSSQKFIQEWQTPSFADWYGTLFFLTLFASIALSGVLLLRARTASGGHLSSTQPHVGETLGSWGVRFSELLVLTALAVMALRDARSIIWFGLFAAPLIAALLGQIAWHNPRINPAKRHQAKRQRELVPQSVQIVNAIIALLLISSTILFLPWNKPALPMPPEYLKNFAPTPRGLFPIGFKNDPPLLLENNTPVGAVEFLRNHPPRQRIWNDFVYGSYLTWATLYSPALTPHVDPRVEMHPLPFWEEYGRIAEGAPDAARSLKAGGFSDALLDIKEEPKLIRHLQGHGWRVVWPVLSKGQSLPREGAVLLRLDN